MTYSLRHVRGSADLDIPPAQHSSVHLFERQLRALGNLVLDKGKALVLLGDRVPRHVDGLDGAEGQEGGSDGVFLQLERDAADVDSVMWDIVSSIVVRACERQPSGWCNQILSAKSVFFS